MGTLKKKKRSSNDLSNDAYAKFLSVFLFLFFSEHMLWVLIWIASQVDAIQKGTHNQGSGNSEIWIGPVDDNDVINEPISKKKKKKKKYIISPVTKTNDNWQSYNSF